MLQRTKEELDAAVAGQTINTTFLSTVRDHGDAVALRWGTEGQTRGQWTYAEYAQQVARAVAGLKALGFGPGQRLIMMLRNRPEFHVLDTAVYFCGGTAVSIYNSSSEDQIEYLANHSEATVVVAEDADFLARFLAVREKLPSLKQLVVVDDPEGAAPADVTRWDALMEASPVDLESLADAAKPEDLATLIYTSGTTGPPKAVMISHYNVTWTVESLRTVIDAHPGIDYLVGLRAVSYLPMAHIAERMTSHYLAMSLGMAVTTCPDATQIAAYLRDVKPNIVFGVPRVWEKIYAGIQAAVSADPERAQKLKEAVDAALPLADRIGRGEASDEDRATYDFLDQVAFKNLRGLVGLDEAKICMTGAAPMPRELQLWYRAVGVPISDIYGMSESCGPMTWEPIQVKPGTVGRAMPGMTVKLGDDGEVVCSGGNVFSGYLKSPEQTAESLDDAGFLHSGDIGQLDEDGYFRIVDRKKELIITAGGKNISPANLESALKMIPLVGQACAIGDQRPFVSALLVLDPDVAKAWAAKKGVAFESLADLATHPDVVAEVEAGLESAMAPFNNAEKVKKVKLLGTEWLPDSVELTPTSKLKRRDIHQKYAAEIEALYAR